MATVKGTNKADKITVNASEVIVVTGKKGKPSAISKSGKNTINGAAGKDTITVSGGKSNYIYGGKGNDTFVISKKSTGTALVKDFSNKEIVKIAGGAVKNIKVSGKDIIIYGGKKGKASLTLKSAKSKTFTVTDSNSNDYSYSVSSGLVKATLKAKIFNGYNGASYSTASFVTTIDARKVTNRNINIAGNAKANTIYVAKTESGTTQGMAGKDTVIVTSGNSHKIYGDDKDGKLSGNDTITINGGDYNYVYAGGGIDTVNVNGGSCHTINGDAGNDVITIKAGSSHTINGGTGIDTIMVYSGYNTVNGGNDGDKIHLYKGIADNNRINADEGNDTVIVYGGAKHNIKGGNGNDTITLENGAGNDQKLYGQGGNDSITVNAGNSHWIEGGEGDDTIKINAGDSHNIFSGTSTGTGKDTIIVNAGSKHNVNNGGGNADIQILSTAGDSIIINGSDSGAENVTIYGGNSHTVKLLDGDDTIKISGGNNHKIKAGSGDDVITITGGKGHTIDADAGKDYYNLNGGTDHEIWLGSGTKFVDISAGNVTLNQNGNASEKITVHWSEQIGTLKINSGSNSGTNNDLLIIKGANSSDFYYKITGNTLTLTPVSTDDKYFGTGINIYNWKNGKAFSAGITFDNNETLSFDTINTKAGF